MKIEDVVGGVEGVDVAALLLTVANLGKSATVPREGATTEIGEQQELEIKNIKQVIEIRITCKTPK